MRTVTRFASRQDWLAHTEAQVRVVVGVWVVYTCTVQEGQKILWLMVAKEGKAGVLTWAVCRYM